MTKILTLNEMLDLLIELDDTKVKHFAKKLTKIGQEMTDHICKSVGVLAPHGCVTEESEVGGTATAFYAPREGFEAPEAFDFFDVGEELEVWTGPANTKAARAVAALRKRSPL